CGRSVRFVFVPWVRALKMVEHGDADAAFNSSFSPIRAKYGAYPMKDGVPDESRASLRYEYIAYAAADTTDAALLKNGEISDRRVVAERAASIISELNKRGARVTMEADYLTMLRQVAFH